MQPSETQRDEDSAGLEQEDAEEDGQGGEGLVEGAAEAGNEATGVAPLRPAFSVAVRPRARERERSRRREGKGHRAVEANVSGTACS